MPFTRFFCNCSRSLLTHSDRLPPSIDALQKDHLITSSAGASYLLEWRLSGRAGAIEAAHPVNACVLKQPALVQGFSFSNLTVTSTRIHNRRFL
jgi:hypothetical protein